MINDNNIFQYWKKIISIYLLGFHLTTSKIWFGNPLFPKVTICDFFENLSPIFGQAIFLLLLLSLLLSIFIEQNKSAIIASVVLQLLLICLDINQLQPYTYQCLLIFVIFLFSKPIEQRKALVLLLLFSIYFFSGANKFSGAFLHQVWEKLLLNKVFHIYKQNLFFHYIGLVVPIIEITLAFALLTNKFRKYSVCLLILMHLFIISILLILKWNYIVIPWNILQIVLLYSLLSIKISFLNFKKTTAFTIIFFAIPFLHLFNVVNLTYLSFDLYSGKAKNMWFCFNDEQMFKKYKAFAKIIRVNNEEVYAINIRKWADNEIYISPFPSEFYFKKLKHKIKSENKNSKIEFKITQYPNKISSL